MMSLLESGQIFKTRGRGGVSSMRVYLRVQNIKFARRKNKGNKRTYKRTDKQTKERMKEQTKERTDAHAAKNSMDISF